MVNTANPMFGQRPQIHGEEWVPTSSPRAPPRPTVPHRAAASQTPRPSGPGKPGGWGSSRAELDRYNLCHLRDQCPILPQQTVSSLH
ncbi:hypothetical protein J6590_039388 [Homalodisca vitripennis]|nr:hypothetical protein J6590_039388 [Homalodisca vitripennis]